MPDSTYFPISAQVALRGNPAHTGRVVGHDHRGDVEYTVVRWHADGAVTARATSALIDAEGEPLGPCAVCGNQWDERRHNAARVVAGTGHPFRRLPDPAPAGGGIPDRADIRQDIGNMSGPASARTVPFDTGVQHGPWSAREIAQAHVASIEIALAQWPS
jgi:hypothetical protein